MLQWSHCCRFARLLICKFCRVLHKLGNGPKQTVTVEDKLELKIKSFCFILGESHVPYQSKHTTVFVEHGETIVLNCTCSKSNGDHVQGSWIGPYMSTSKEDNIPYTEGLIMNPELNISNIHIIGDHELGTCNLKITNFSNINEGSYECNNLLLDDPKILEHTYIVSIKTPPMNLEIQSAAGSHTIRGVEDVAMKLVCTVSRGQPAEVLKWSENGTMLKEGREGRLDYIFVPNRYDHQKLFTCSVEHELLTFPLTKSVNLDIEFKPYVAILPLKQDFQREGTSTELCCKSKSNPSVKYATWKKAMSADLWITNSTRNDTDNEDQIFCLPISPLHRDSTGIYTCSAENSVGIGKSSMHLKVLYPPTVTVTYKRLKQIIHLQCIPKGEPDNYTFDEWEHRSEFNDCRTSQRDKLIQVQFCAKFIFFPVYPTQNKGVQYGQYGEESHLTIYIYKHDAFKSIQKHGETLNLERKKKRVKTSDSFHGINIMVFAIEYWIHLPVATEEDFTNYTIEACNRENCNSFIVEFKSVNYPEPPENLSAVLNSTTFVVYWHPGFDGGIPQRFYIEYRPESKPEWEVVGPIVQSSLSMDRELEYRLKYVLIAKKFYLRMYAKNLVGQSKYSNIFFVEMEDCSCNSEKYTNHIWQITSSLLGGSLIFSFCVNIYCLLTRQQKSGIVLEIPLEEQHYEIGPINDNNANIQGIPNHLQETVTSVDRPASQSANSNASSFQNVSSSGSSVPSLSNLLLNEDGYENPYQMIDHENIEMHPYSIITSNMYQNTTIFHKNMRTNNLESPIQNDKKEIHG
ncbi:unnamed protein product [Mytilus coruscus]|uniref:NCAM n=1 Tax=Mytilus coruscus TaxID=42192 RepID=A0A6J8BJB7_MYTCO|nr:unnamed protein product [Mytilus coruscus]